MTDHTVTTTPVTRRIHDLLRTTWVQRCETCGRLGETSDEIAAKRMRDQHRRTHG